MATKPIRPGVETDQSTIKGTGLPEEPLTGTSVNTLTGEVSIVSADGEILIKVDTNTQRILLSLPNRAIRVYRPVRIAKQMAGWLMAGESLVFNRPLHGRRYNEQVNGGSITIFNVISVTAR